ncbi:MAG TPA: diacylglycerol kinase family lipid kinase [bacterium]|nr:diacylglycerol kinase family lipid kinase [bacterium]
MAKIKVIVNPAADRGNAGLAVPDAEACLKKAGLTFEIVRTERPLHAVELAQDAVRQGFEIVVSMGGDGTVNEVLNGLVLARQKGLGEAALGVLGVGRGNDFAFGVNIPSGLENGCAVLAAGRRRRIDIGRVRADDDMHGRYFGNGIGIGFDTVVGFEAAKMTRLHGFLSYLVAALKTLFLYYIPPRVRIVFDEVSLEQPALMISIMNGRRMGGGFMMAPEGIPDDGKFDVCCVSWANRFRLLALMLNFMNGTQAGKKPVRFERSRRIEVTALDGSLPVHADGETLCVEGKRLQVELLPGELEVITG